MALKDRAMASVLLELFALLGVFIDWPRHMYGEDENGVEIIMV